MLYCKINALLYIVTNNTDNVDSNVFQKNEITKLNLH
jgi:hypothetical protein